MAHIQVKKSKFFSSTCLLKEIRKIKNEKKVASVNNKKTLHIQKSAEKLMTNYCQTGIK